MRVEAGVQSLGHGMNIRKTAPQGASNLSAWSAALSTARTLRTRCPCAALSAGRGRGEHLIDFGDETLGVIERSTR
jgi:hypothetical protein